MPLYANSGGRMDIEDYKLLLKEQKQIANDYKDLMFEYKNKYEHLFSQIQDHYKLFYKEKNEK